MKRIKTIFSALIFPHQALFLLLVPLSSALLIYSFVYAESRGPISYLAYALSAYTLTTLCTKTPQLIRFFEKMKTENLRLNRYLTDVSFRISVSLYIGLFVSTAYAIFQLGLGFYHHSIWFYALAVYYLLFSVMRFFLLRDVKTMSMEKDLVSEYKRYRFCGILLLLMNLALGVIVTYITWQNRGFSHHAITTIAMATYTFGSLIVAIIKLIEYRKYNSPLFSAAKLIRLASASVSLLTLETAMFSAFGSDNSETLRRVMTGATGAVVCLFFLVAAIYMILHATKQLNKLKFTK